MNKWDGDAQGQSKDQRFDAAEAPACVIVWTCPPTLIVVDRAAAPVFGCTTYATSPSPSSLELLTITHDAPPWGAQRQAAGDVT
jgi:hypothetical protein